MKGTMEGMCSWEGDEDVSIPNDEENRPLVVVSLARGPSSLARGPSLSSLGMGASSSPPQPHILSIVSSVAASNYHVIVVSAFPMQF